VRNDSVAFRPTHGLACVLFRSAGSASFRGVRIRRAPAFGISTRFLHIQEERLLNGVLVRAGLDVDTSLQKNAGTTQDVLRPTHRLALWSKTLSTPHQLLNACICANVIQEQLALRPPFKGAMSS